MKKVEVMMLPEYDQNNEYPSGEAFGYFCDWMVIKDTPGAVIDLDGKFKWLPLSQIRLVDTDTYE